MARSKNKRRKQAKSSPVTPVSAAVPPAAASRSPASSPSPSSSPTQLFGYNIPLPTVAAAALCALTLVAFFPALTAGFVWDDVVFTEAKPVQRWSGLLQIWFAPRALTLSSEGHYWPVLYTTFWLEHKLWGHHPLGYHLVNILLHAGVTLLLWRLLSRLKVPGAWLAAAVFAVHPVHTEAVAWVIARKDVLAALFFFASALLYLRFDDDRRRRDYFTALALFVAGMFSKSTAVMLPAALLIWHWWRHGRVTAADAMRVLPFVLLAAGISFADWSYYKSVEDTPLDYTLIERAQIAAGALWFYAGKILWPDKLMVIYPHFTVGVGDVVAWAYLVAAGALAAVLWFARAPLTRAPFAAATLFAVVLAPVLGFVDYGYMQFAFAADRYQYLASSAVIAVVVAVVVQLIHRLPPASRNATVAVTALAMLLPLTALTWQQAGIYQNAGAFFAHILAHNPDARGARNNYGQWFVEQGNRLRDDGKFDEAFAEYATAAEQIPDSASVPVNIGIAFQKMGRTDDAEAQFKRALELDPDDTDALGKLAEFRLGQQQYADALALFDKIIRLEPKKATYYSGKGVALFNLGRHDDALNSIDRALELDPQLQQARDTRRVVVADYEKQNQPGVKDYELGETHHRAGRFADALASYRAAADARPDWFWPHLGMGKAAADLGRMDDAQAHFADANTIAPDDPDVLSHFAAFRLRQRRHDDALALFESLLALQPDNARYHSGKGVALAGLKRFDEALRSIDRALELDPSLTDARANRERVRRSLQQ